MRLTLIILSLCVSLCAANASEPNLTFAKMVENFDEYKDKEITVNLRLRSLDRELQYIIFYDSKNRNISFDYSNSRPIKRLIKANPLLHDGLVYKVRFIPRDLDERSNIKADLLGYEPLFFERLLPYGKAE